MDALSGARRWPTMRRPMLVGSLAGLGLLAFYLGTIALAEDTRHAWQQLQRDRWFVAALTLGFGTQMALWSVLRRLHARSMASGMVASTGTSTVAMLACCAHHLVDVLPILGLSGAAVVLTAYQAPLLWAGLGLNALSVLWLLRQLRRQLRVMQPAAANHY
jgi:hypothetical protein